MGLRQIGGRGGIKAGGSVFDGVKPVAGNGFAGCQLNAQQQLRTQPLDRVAVDGVDVWHGSAPTDALLLTHCGDHGLNLYFHRLSATGPRSFPATKTDKEGNVGAETARLMISLDRFMTPL